ncbi:hypothetical protein ACFZ8E_02625 [Methylobacterium sp. HMF5984]|uniref:hypothetical protein n=1 Tax=Methylobacterium sp. HMF5984 TaxID=3367370 RepID=UPI0038552EDB
MVTSNRLRSVATATLIAMAAAMPPAMADESMSAITGHWHVAKVAVPDSGVQALVDNDPSLMGKRLTFTSAQLVWNQMPSTGDVCTSPSFEQLDQLSQDVRPELRKLGMRQPVAYTLHCRSGGWGPSREPTIYQGAAGALALPWYDGTMLMLVRDPGKRP